MRVFTTVMHAVSSVFGCTHERMSRPFTIEHESYMVCLECGQKSFYSPATMRRLSRREVKRLQRPAMPAFLQAESTPDRQEVQAMDGVKPTLAA